MDPKRVLKREGTLHMFLHGSASIPNKVYWVHKSCFLANLVFKHLHQILHYKFSIDNFVHPAHKSEGNRYNDCVVIWLFKILGAKFRISTKFNYILHASGKQYFILFVGLSIFRDLSNWFRLETGINKINKLSL